MPCFSPGVIKPNQIHRLLKRSDNWIVTGASLIRKEAMIAAGGFDDELSSFADGFLVRKIALMRGIYYAPRAVMTWRVFSVGLSRQTSLDLKKAHKHLELSQQKILADKNFPIGYGDLYCGRWRFATARLALSQECVDFSVVSAIGARTRLDHWLIAKASILPGNRVVRIALLGWFWLRWRPYRLRDLLVTFLLRRLWYRAHC